MSSPRQPDHWIGRLIDGRQRYRIEKRLGGGSMGDVFLAMDTLLGHQVALKLLKETLIESEELRKRFEREITVCAALDSDYIVKVKDYGATLEGYPFYVMEYLRGQTLGQLLRQQQRLSVEQAVGIVTQVCEGLRLAHEGVTLWREGSTVSEQVKVVHRDLKPDNIFLVPTVIGELVKILDFGIAKIRYDQVKHSNLTAIFVGTFRYAAPEQLIVAENLDGRADIYSLGIIIYEMLSGTDPFGFGINARSPTGDSWAQAHRYQPPAPLRSQPGCEHLSPKLEAVVMRCLQKAPNNRFASVEELNRELQAAASSTSGQKDPGVTILQERSLPEDGDPGVTILQERSLPEDGDPGRIMPQPIPTYLRQRLSNKLLLSLGIGIATVLVLTVAIMHGFGGRDSKVANVRDVPRGKFQYGGSTSWAPIRGAVDSVIQGVWPEFELRYVDPVNSPPSSGTGIIMLLNNELAFAQSSRSILSKEYGQAQQRGFSLKEIPVAIDGLAVAVHPSLNIPGLTLAQLKSIYSGKIVNWKQIGGPDLGITPYSRPVGSNGGGTVDLFLHKILEGQAFGSNIEFVPSTTSGVRKLAANPGGIYYASAPEVVPQCSIKPVPLGLKLNEFVPPYQEPFVPLSQCPGQRNQTNIEAFQKGQYPITRKLLVVVKQNGQVEEQAGNAYANILLTDEGQRLIQKSGFTKIR